METNSDADFEEEEDEEPEFSGKQVLTVLFKPWNDHLEKDGGHQGGSSEESQAGQEMVTMVSRGEVEVVR